MMRETYPDFRKARDIQVRLQWGAISGNEGFRTFNVLDKRLR